jgi:hypothetical protein
MGSIKDGEEKQVRRTILSALDTHLSESSRLFSSMCQSESACHSTGRATLLSLSFHWCTSRSKGCENDGLIGSEAPHDRRAYKRRTRESMRRNEGVEEDARRGKEDGVSRV